MPDLYSWLDDEQVLQRAIDACKKAAEAEPGSIVRSVQWAVFDSAMAELDRRMVKHVLGKLRGTE